MAVQSAVRLHVHIAKDRTVHLPDDFPEGDAEVIVLYDAAPVADERARKAALRRRAFGADAGRFTVPDDFDAPLPADLQRLFDGEDDGPLGSST
jgi:hypothetical protein